MQAAHTGSNSIIYLLLEAGATVDIENKNVETLVDKGLVPDDIAPLLNQN